MDTKILSTPVFCRQEYFVIANILSVPIFFVAANICRRQYFVATNILSVFRFKDDYLLLLIVFCVYHDYYDYY